MDSTVTAEDIEKWGLPLRDLYRLAMAFYRENRKKNPCSYEDNLKLASFTQQATHGPFDAATAPPVGVLDVIGRDRRVAWQNLGQITKVQALEGFVDSLDRLCPDFKAHVEAVKRDRESQQRIREEEARQRQVKVERDRKEQLEEEQMEESRSREELQRRELQSALNQQTFHQFKAYAEKQYPGNPEQQGELIRQLQSEHYHQYMQQLQSQFPIGTQQQQQQPMIDQQVSVSTDTNPEAGEAELSDGEGEGEDTDAPVIERANMWTRADMKTFKTEVSAGKGDGVIRVGHGETVTVRVPTHEGGSCLYWEFATDNHDIGFGVYFEWTKPMTTEVSVHISESDEEEDEDAEEGDGECAWPTSLQVLFNTFGISILHLNNSFVSLQMWRLSQSWVAMTWSRDRCNWPLAQTRLRCSRSDPSPRLSCPFTEGTARTRYMPAVMLIPRARAAFIC